METQQAADQATKTFRSLFTNPSELIGIITNPAKNGLTFYKSLSNTDKRNIAIAAGLGLIIYGFTLNRRNV